MASSSSTSSAMAKQAHNEADLDELLIASHQSSLLSASAAASDLDLAFRLQLQEALAASLLSSPSSAATETKEEDEEEEEDCAAYVLKLQAEELERFRTERKDREMQEMEIKRLKCDLRLKEYDGRFAEEIEGLPDEDWDEFGDNFEKPVDPQNPNQLLSAEEEKPFNVYFKGMAMAELLNGSQVQLAGIGVAICDPKNNLLLKIQKPAQAVGMSREVLEAKALIEALNAALSLGIRNVNVYFDYKVLYNHVKGLWTAKQKKVLNLINQISLLQRKFKKCKIFLLPRCHIHFVFRLARDVIDSQLSRTDQSESSNAKGRTETCHICLEPTDKMFCIEPCKHRFCVSCLKQHVEVRLLHAQLPFCPSENCKVKLGLENSEKFLTPKLLRIMSERIKEESIQPENKVYCPNPRCSFLMSLNEVIKPNYPQNNVNYASSSKNMVGNLGGLRKCVKCEGLFCINCKVMWHEGVSCGEYKMRNPNLRCDDYKLHLLARKSMWKQCVKCKHMIELAEGCFHMTCKCGYEFCYTCGKEWKDKKATCYCPLWDENYILHDESEEDEDEDDYDDDDDDDDYEDGYDYHNNNNNNNNNNGGFNFNQENFYRLHNDPPF